MCGNRPSLISPSPLSFSKESPEKKSVCAGEEGKKGGRRGGGVIGGRGGEVGKDH